MGRNTVNRSLAGQCRSAAHRVMQRAPSGHPAMENGVGSNAEAPAVQWHGVMSESVQVGANPSDVTVQSAGNLTSTELTGRHGEAMMLMGI